MLEGKGFQALKGPYNMEYMHLVFGEYSPTSLKDIRRFFASEPFCWFVNKDERHVAEQLLINGFRADGSDPVMALKLAEYNLSLNTLTNIKIIENRAMLEDFAQVAHSAYDMPVDGFRKFALMAACENIKDIKVFVGYNSKNEAIACSMVHIGNEVAAIYWIGVVEDYRKQGIGSDMTKICIQYAKEHNTVKQILLQSFPLGVSLYQKLGFKVVNGMDHFWSK